MATLSVTTQLDEVSLGRLDDLAVRLHRSRDSIVAEAVKAFVDEELDLLESLDEAEAQIERGEFHTQEQIEAWFNERYAGSRRD